MINLQDPWKLLFAKNKLKCLTKKIIVLNLSPQTCYLQKVCSPSRVLDDHYNSSFPNNLRSIFAATGNCQEVSLHLLIKNIAFVLLFKNKFTCTSQPGWLSRLQIGLQAKFEVLTILLKTGASRWVGAVEVFGA